MQLYFELSDPVVRELPRHPLFDHAAVEHQRVTEIYHDTAGLDLWAAGFVLCTVWCAGRWWQVLRRVDEQAPLAVDEVEGLGVDRSKLPVCGALGRTLERIVGDKPLITVFEAHLQRIRRQPCLDDGSRVGMVLDRGRLCSGDTSRPVAHLHLSLDSGAPGALYELAQGLARRWTLPLAPPPEQVGFDLYRKRPVTHHKATRLDLNPGQNAEEAFVIIAKACLAQAQANLPAVLEGQEEGVHQMRVAFRRLRSALKAYRRLIPRSASAGLVAEIRWLNEHLGPCRDWDVFIGEGLLPLAAHFPQRRGLQQLLAQARRLRGQHYADLHQALDQARYHRLMLDLHDWLDQKRWRDACDEKQQRRLEDPAGDFAGGLLRRLHRRVAGPGGRFEQLTTEERHELRIRIKELRYALEFFASLYPAKAVAAYRKAASDLQDSLGVMNDIATSERLLDEAGQGPSSLARALVEGWYGCKLDIFLGGFPKAWAAFHGCRRPWKK